MPKAIKYLLFFLLAAYPVLTQYYYLGWDYLSQGGEQYIRHISILNGESPFFNPWQYRVLCPWLIEGIASVLEYLKVSNVYPFAFLIFRYLVQVFLVVAAYRFYRQFVKSELLLILGLIFLTYACGEGHYKSDLNFNTFLEVAFYLSLGVLLTKERWSLIIPLCFLAFLNRESSGLFPLLILASAYQLSDKNAFRNKVMAIGLGSALLFIFIFSTLRWYYGYPDRLVCDFDILLEHNFAVLNAYFRVFAVLSIFPILFLVKWRSIYPFFKRWFWLLVPVWVCIHFTMASVHESRIFLVPLAIVFLPAVLCLVEKEISLG